MRWLFPLILLAGCAPSPAPAPEPAPPRPIILHLPGINGICDIDKAMVKGLQSSDMAWEAEFYDWTCGDPGLGALRARQRNLEQARIIADRIAALRRAGRSVYLTCHSGGAGPATWALEMLPDDVRVECFVMLAPALSPQYDLSRAAAHVGGRLFCYYSELDNVVLGTGTKLMGTIDGRRVDAAGRVGFTLPASADKAQYAKLVQRPYDPAWARFGHIGGHMGWMEEAFARAILAPAMLGRPERGDDKGSTRPAVRDLLWPMR